MSSSGGSAIALLLFDAGGVLGTNGWDRNERAGACRVFALDHDAFEARHEQVIATWETGNMTMDEYLDVKVFYEPRPFARQAFRDFMFAQSVPDRQMLTFVAELVAKRRYTTMMMNNEPAELNEYRVRGFGLRPLFNAFLSSCYLGMRKPSGDYYDRALAIAHADPGCTVFIDDREENLVPARERGVHTVHATGVEVVRAGLAELGVTTSTQ
ncbi:MAG: HAD-IA family hydrolase [Gemmatimonadaceae bacterium]